MIAQYLQVLEFMKAMKQLTPSIPTMPHPDVAMARFRMLNEENAELLDAKEYHEYVDAIVDILYLTFGAAVEAGLDADTLTLCFQEVHRANMSKFWSVDEMWDARSQKSIEWSSAGEGKKIAKRDGKVIKPPSFTPPDIKAVLAARFRP